MFTSVNTRAASAYKRVAVDTGVQTADPHTLVAMLFEALIQSLNLARGALERQDVVAKGMAIGKSIRIMEEGLKAGLNLKEGGQLAANLKSLYDYSIQRLTLANLRNDIAPIREVLNLIEPLADSWKQMRTEGALQGA
ncbi:flagellar export chaperone FliS [Hydrogenophaga sp. BPS33]|uniref:flagellar export chaperone FliS n=1 Tax=Hydrogenophaga sp. BPS33 TaxID=2651974 RepID=UPI00131F5DEE|nr:flagellar export chaperone FliS [Hydrogenophaga sp. BPS33]QHE88094.1 flagellar export chaperone FliS [Hydrogenophaga sp. BPS33]